MLILKFNAEQMALDLCDALVDGVDECIAHFMSDAKSNLKADDQSTEKAIFDMATQQIIGTAAFYAHSILESYGRGRKMSVPQNIYVEYIQSEFWNPNRRSKRIVGRSKGSYVNIFGETVTSSGTREGKALGGDSPPSYAIQNAEKKLKEGIKSGGYVMRILESHADEFFNTMNAMKYFYNEDISQ